MIEMVELVMLLCTHIALGKVQYMENVIVTFISRVIIACGSLSLWGILQLLLLQPTKQ